uniref:Carbonic anhydrase n=1 Tax=Varanus komodoensis TaxID=61221 RepID=A0A8D2Q529_VARKO
WPILAQVSYLCLFAFIPLGPSHWKDITASCGGENQSPINIDRRKTQRDKNLDEILFEGYDQAPPGRWRLLNDGHTGGGQRCSAWPLCPPPPALPFKFRALQFHFHWGDLDRNGSEHMVDGRQYPMEMHLVHVNTKYKTTNEAKGHPNGLAVLSFLFKVSETDNTNYNTIIAGLKNISRAGSNDYVDLASTFSLRNLLPSMASLSKYYRYKGSLTTPSCEEVVVWTVFEEEVPISKQQVRREQQICNLPQRPLKMANNFRPPQPLNRRKVYASRDATLSCSSSLASHLLLPLLWAFLVGHFSGPS